MPSDPYRYPLAPDGVFGTVQGEGHLLGLPTVFVRLAGCSVGCPECDTDYSAAERATAADVARRVAELAGSGGWVWITGGEPADHPLGELVWQLRRTGLRVALATSGVRSRTRDDWSLSGGFNPAAREIDFLSVSPHFPPAELEVRAAHQLNLVPGLGRLALADWAEADLRLFTHRWVTPPAGNPDGLLECLAFLRRRPDFRLGVQAHRTWGLP